MTVLSVMWLPVFVIPMVVHHLPAGISQTLDTLDYLIWATLAVEYMAKLYLAPDRLRFAGTHVLDLVLIAVPALRPLRALRLLRVIRLSRAGVLLVSALGRVRALVTHRGLHFVLLSVIGIIAVTAALEVVFESGAPGATITNYGQALWWAVVTVTTVGYGDMHPVTAAGQGVAVALMITGIGLLGVLTATVASYFVEQNSGREKQELSERLDRIENMLAHALASKGGSD
jgi:voltage-gated potassium channel